MSDTNTPSPIAEISHGPSKFDMFLDQHQKKLIVLAILATLGTVTYIVWDGVKKMGQQDAGSALYNASGENELKKVIQEGPSAVQATGKYLLAREQAKIDKKQAITTLTELIGSHPKESITNDAKLQLGLLLLADNQKTEALNHLETLSNDSEVGYLQAFAKFALAEIALKDGNPDKAKELYESAAKLTEHSRVTSSFSTYAKMTSVQAPIRVAPPKKQEVEPAAKKTETDATASPQAEPKKQDTPVEAAAPATPAAPTEPAPTPQP